MPDAPAPRSRSPLQLQWFTQGQFAGYFAAVDQGFYAEQGLDVADQGGRGRHRPADGAGPGPGRLRDRLGAQGAGLARAGRGDHRRRPGLPALGHLPGLVRRTRASAAPADLRGKKVGNWGFGNEFELFAGMTGAGLTPATDVTLVQQQFDMQALLSGEIDAAQAMSYNEYAQVLEAHEPGDRAALPAGGLHR